MLRHILIIIFCVGITSILAQERQCASCGKLIKDNESYKQILDKIYHPEHFKCTYCQDTISGKFFVSDNRFYHPRCFASHKLPQCTLCNKPIQDEYITFENNRYHYSCYREHIAPRCRLCGDVIENEYIEDFWGNPYHTSHQETHPQCWYCGRFISADLTGGGSLATNDQVICSICIKETVDEFDQARRILQEVRERLASAGIIVQTSDIDLQLSSWPDLKQLTPQTSRYHTGFTETEVVYFNNEKLKETFKIYILYGMPTYHYIATAAHELMHVWQHCHSSGRDDLKTVEGSCNYAAYLVLRSYTDKRAAYVIQSLIQNKNPVYGDGFRMIQTYVDQNSVEQWLHVLKRGERIQSLQSIRDRY